jgi:N-acetylglucosaminyldiphosphoundecaprenol N-acetyl-beta-D-mannosaminyltransferase
VATVNNLIEGCDDPGCNTMEAADLATPDGMPLVWGLRLLGAPDASHVHGPDLTLWVYEGGCPPPHPGSASTAARTTCSTT